jgi:hypothetical protein
MLVVVLVGVVSMFGMNSMTLFASSISRGLGAP